MNSNFYQTLLCLVLLSTGIAINMNAQEIVTINFKDELAISSDFSNPTYALDFYSNETISFEQGPQVVNTITGNGEPAIAGATPPNALKLFVPVSTGNNPEIVINFDVPVDDVSFKVGVSPLVNAFLEPDVFDAIVDFRVTYDNGTELALFSQNLFGSTITLVDLGVLGFNDVSKIEMIFPLITVACVDDITYTVPAAVNECPEDFIADAGEDQEVIIGYGSLNTANLEVDFSGGAGGESVLWSTGETTASIEVSPEASTTYSVTVTDVNGCEATDDVTVAVEDVRCSLFGGRFFNVTGVTMCFRGFDYCVSRRLVRLFNFFYGATVGSCGNSNARRDRGEKPEINFAELEEYLQNMESNDVMVFPSPATDFVNIDPGTFLDKAVSLSVFDVSGRMLMQRAYQNISFERVDISTLESGIYHLRLEDQSGESVTQRFVKY